MDPAYGARYRDLYERHWWWRAREAMVCGLLAQHAPSNGFGPILDVGCGDGLFLPALRRFGTPEGLEPDAALVTEIGRSRGTIHTVPFDTHFQPARRFGLILMLDVLEHLDDDAAALRHAVDLLAPGGLLLITVPAFRLLWTVHDDYNHHRTRYTVASFERAAARAEVVVAARRYFFNWLFPLKLLVRLKESLRPGEPTMPTVPGALVNRVFYGTSRLEQHTWGRLPIPFGSSLLALCRAG